MKIQIGKLVYIRNMIALSVIVLIVAVCSYLVYMQYSCRFNIHIYTHEPKQWEGWGIKYTLDEISEVYPEFQPFVSTGESRLPEGHRRAGAGDTILWEECDGVYVFHDIYSKKRISNYFHSVYCDAVMPEAYLHINHDGCLKPELGKNIQEGTYYISRCNTPNLKCYEIYGFFIEIRKEGWRIAGYSIFDADIICPDKAPTTCRKYISPFLDFNKKYTLRLKVDIYQEDITIFIGKE